MIQVVEVLNSLDDFMDYCDNAGASSPLLDEMAGLPCYLTHISETYELINTVSVGDYLSLVASHSSPDGILQYSVTTKESRFQEWVDCATSVPGGVVMEIPRGGACGSKYTCFLCMVPVSPRMDLV